MSSGSHHLNTYQWSVRCWSLEPQYLAVEAFAASKIRFCWLMTHDDSIFCGTMRYQFHVILHCTSSRVAFLSCTAASSRFRRASSASTPFLKASTGVTSCFSGHGDCGCRKTSSWYQLDCYGVFISWCMLSEWWYSWEMVLSIGPQFDKWHSTHMTQESYVRSW